MTGFAKEAAKHTEKSPKLPSENDRHFSVAKALQTKDSGKDQTRQERHGNPGKPQPSEQFPTKKGLGPPFNVMDSHWQGKHTDGADKASKYYNRGAARQLSRRIPIGPGGSGDVVASTKHSSLAPGHDNLAKKGMR